MALSPLPPSHGSPSFPSSRLVNKSLCRGESSVPILPPVGSSVWSDSSSVFFHESRRSSFLFFSRRALSCVSRITLYCINFRPNHSYGRKVAFFIPNAPLPCGPWPPLLIRNYEKIRRPFPPLPASPPMVKKSCESAFPFSCSCDSFPDSHPLLPGFFFSFKAA